MPTVSPLHTVHIRIYGKQWYSMLFLVQHLLWCRKSETTTSSTKARRTTKHINKQHCEEQAFTVTHYICDLKPKHDPQISQAWVSRFANLVVKQVQSSIVQRSVFFEDVFVKQLCVHRLDNSCCKSEWFVHMNISEIHQPFRSVFVGPRRKRSIFGIAGLDQNRGQCPLVLFKVQLLIQEEISITNCGQPWWTKSFQHIFKVMLQREDFSVSNICLDYCGWKLVLQQGANTCPTCEVRTAWPHQPSCKDSHALLSALTSSASISWSAL